MCLGFGSKLAWHVCWELSFRFKVKARRELPIFPPTEFEPVNMQVTREQAGGYLCVASNGHPPAVSRRFHLHVKFRYVYSKNLDRARMIYF
jgi:hypothetical protein